MEVLGGDVQGVVRAHCAEADFARAATRIVEDYGPELYRFVRSRCAADDDANEVFSILCEDLWRGLPDFGWRCSLRGWLYKLARHAGARFALAPHRRVERNVALSDVCSQIAERASSSSTGYRRESVQDRLRSLRERLSDEDRLILVLRVDRELGFREIAEVFASPDLELSGAELEREAARVRKRFELTKRRLRAWAVEAGLVADPR